MYQGVLIPGPKDFEKSDHYNTCKFGYAHISKLRNKPTIELISLEEAKKRHLYICIQLYPNDMHASVSKITNGNDSGDIK